MGVGVDRRRFLTSTGAFAAATLLEAGEAAPPRICFGCAAITWDGDDPRAIREIAEAGFRGIQLRRPAFDRWKDAPAELAGLLAGHGLTFVALSSGTLRPDAAFAREEVELHLRHAAFLRAAGGHYLQLLDERPKGRAPHAGDYVQLGRMLGEIGRRCADIGVTLGYHNHMGSLGERPEEVARVLDGADPRYVKLILDTAHCAQAGGDPAAAAAAQAARLLFVHVKDVESPAPGGGPESYRFVELGRGKVDLPSFFASLRRIDFEGWAVVELDGVPEPGGSEKESALVSRRYLEETLGFRLGRS